MSRTVLALTTAMVVVTTASMNNAHAQGTPSLARAAWRLGVRALDHVDATPAQRRAVSDAARALGRRLQPHEAAAQQWAHSAYQMWTADTVTRTSVEAVRRDGVQLVDATSAEAVDFVVDVADTLTPDQRLELAREAHVGLLDILRD